VFSKEIPIGIDFWSTLQVDKTLLHSALKQRVGEDLCTLGLLMSMKRVLYIVAQLTLYVGTETLPYGRDISFNLKALLVTRTFTK
jgi:hypothetical protein